MEQGEWVSFLITTIGAAVVGLAGCQTTQYAITPGADMSNVTYAQGAATVTSDDASGAVKVTLMGFTPGGRIQLAVAAINKSASAANLGIENVTATDSQGAQMHVWTRDEIIARAQRRAGRRLECCLE